jgi:DNA mismatch repair protein MutL
MPTIKIMDEVLSNKIAAGEVVERPRSIVKELVENALDAGATDIKIITEQSGIASISVEDNGIGMDEEDAILSFQRHATSKIATEHDLFDIHTLGFRGEALAAISSVSKMKMHTGKIDQPAIMIAINGGKLENKEITNSRIGTKIEVKQLFFNTPARLKHLKTLQTELLHITEYLQKMAIARPDVRFEYLNDQKLVFRTFGSNKLEETLALIYGDKVANFTFEVSAKDNDFEIIGIITHPQMQRTNSRVINISINNRTVRNYGINQAILAGYGNLLPRGTFPIVALNIIVDTKLVDVNVHPAKLEVRLSNEKQLEKLIQNMISQTLQEQNLIYRDITMPKKVKNTNEQMIINLPNKANPIIKISEEEKITPNTSVAKDNENTQVTSAKQREILKELYNVDLPKPNLNVEETTATYEVDLKASNEIIGKELNNPNKMREDIVNDAKIESVVEADLAVDTKHHATDARETLQLLTIIGQFDATYILAQYEHRLFVIDQHAAQERIKYDDHMKKVRNMETIVTQELLFPLTIHLEGKALIVVQDTQEELQKMGITYEIFGQNEIRINTVPSWIKKESIEEYVRRAVDCLVKYTSADSALVREKELIMLSCKYSIKAHDVLSMLEMQTLIQQLSETQTPFTCPHGRPIIIDNSKYEVERWFKRA